MWFRRDLRTSDNHALLAAVDAADHVVPFFCLDDGLRNYAGAARIAFMYGSLEVLDKRLDGKLVLRTGKPEEMLPALAEEVGATQVFATGESEPYGRDRDDRVGKALAKDGVELVHVDSPYVIEPGFIHKDDGEPFKVYTPFFNQWMKHDHGQVRKAPSNDKLKKVKGEKVPEAPEVDAELPPPGEEAAQKRLSKFLKGQDMGGLQGYKDNRNLPGIAGTTKLSPYLKFGCIHPRQILEKLGTGHNDFALKRELAFRDFYADTIFHNPEGLDHSLNVKMRAYKQDNNAESKKRFQAWKDGMTGYPIVDAGMRQMRQQAWMHNRVRMIVASFLIKDLHVDWTEGADYFMECLVDGDPANNSQGWQWVAGTGRDPSPYYRIFNPITQSKNFDKDGDYIKKFVPELADVPTKYIHAPWENPDGVPEGYPAPIVDHKVERAESLKRYSALK